MTYTEENIMNYTRTHKYAGHDETYIELGWEGNQYYKYDYVKAYVDIVIKPILEKAMNNREEYSKMLAAVYTPNSNRAGFAFYVSISTEEQWLNTDVEIKLECYLRDMGEHYLFKRYLLKDELGEQVSKIIKEFIELIEKDNKKVYSIQ